MKNAEFEKRLKELGLTKKEFAKTVESWLDLYDCKIKYEKIKQELRESGVCADI